MKTSCEEFADRIVDYVDGELSDDEAQVVSRHLSECDRCRETAEALQRSLGLAKVIWLDHLADTTAAHATHGQDARATTCLDGHTTNLPRRRWFYILAAAACILLVTGSSVLLFFRQASSPSPVAFEDVQQQIVRAGTAAQLLAATRIVAQCEGAESIVEQQYRYILREYAGTPAAESIKANHNLNLGGTQND